MTVSPTLLILISAVLHAGWNALLKSAKNKGATSLCVLAVAGLLSVFVAVATHSPWLPLSNPDILPWVIAAGLFEGLYFYTLARALTLSPLGPVYTVIRGGAMLLVWAVSIPLLGERITAHAATGALLVLLGVPLLSPPPSRPGGKLDPAQLRGLQFALISAVCVAGYHLSYGQALTHSATPAPLFAMAMVLAVLLQALLLDMTPIRALKLATAGRADIIKLLTAGSICAGAFLLFLYGLSRSGPGITISLRNTSILFAQLFALFMGERMNRRQWLGVLLSAAGAALLTL